MLHEKSNFVKNIKLRDVINLIFFLLLFYFFKISLDKHFRNKPTICIRVTFSRTHTHTYTQNCIIIVINSNTNLSKLYSSALHPAAIGSVPLRRFQNFSVEGLPKTRWNNSWTYRSKALLSHLQHSWHYRLLLS